MNKIFLPVIIFLFSLETSNAQQVIHACCDTSICLPGSPINLSATVDSGSTGAILDILDDTYSQVVNLGFNFTYFGITYDKCLLSTNCYICFDIFPPDPGSFSAWSITAPAPSPVNPLNSVYGPWQDTDPAVPTYGTVA